MEEKIEKVMVDESDPKKLEERHLDPEGSFLDMYRSLDISRVEDDANLVDLIVKEKVVPESVRYGVMSRENIMVYRGVAKSISGDYYYFNYAPGTEFKLVESDSETKKWEVNKLFKSCDLGCDLIIKNNNSEEEEPDEDDEDAEKAKAPAAQRTAATSPVPEENWIEQQDNLMTDYHPGSTHAQTPDAPQQGRNWHEPLRRAVDGLEGLEPQANVEPQWSTTDLMKAWGRSLQSTAPKTTPEATELERQFLVEVLGKSQAEIESGVKITPWHRYKFNQWKAQSLRSKMNKLSNWLDKKNG